MNHSPFDQLRGSSASVTTRRMMCKAVTGGILGAALTRLGLHEVTAARCKKLKQKCKRTDQCCGKQLVCGRKSTDHRCTSSLPNKNCCVPPGGKCNFIECECCGNYGCDNGKCKRT